MKEGVLIKNFEWCFSIGQKVNGYFDEECKNLVLDDVFEIVDRELDEENNQYFKAKCLRTGVIYENIAASLLA